MIRRLQRWQRGCGRQTAGAPKQTPSSGELGHGRCTASRSAGYTLLELLIVGVLVTVLMAGVWSLLRNWSGLYARGERRVQHMQLVRSLCDQFTDDVHAAAQAAVPDTNHSTPQVGSAPQPQPQDSLIVPPVAAALVGGSDWLILEVIQSANPWQGQTSEPSLAANPYGADDTSQRAGLIAPELRRVIYTFAPPQSDAGDSLSSAVDEMAAADDTELVVGEEPETQPFSGLLRLAVAKESSDLLTGGSSVDPLAGILERDEVSEVVWFELRYYDGVSWQSSWDSQSQGRLPVAVEMRFEVQVPNPVDKKAVSSEDGERELVDQSPSGAPDAMPPSEDARSASLADDQSVGLSDGESAETLYDRCVVFLQAKGAQ